MGNVIRIPKEWKMTVTSVTNQSFKMTFKHHVENGLKPNEHQHEHLLKSIWRMHSRHYSFQIQLQLADSFLKTTTCCRIQAPRAPSLQQWTGFATLPTGRKYAKTTARKVLLGEFVVGTAGGVDDLVRCNGSRVNDGKAAPLSFTPSTFTDRHQRRTKPKMRRWRLITTGSSDGPRHRDLPASSYGQFAGLRPYTGRIISATIVSSVASTVRRRWV